MQNSGENPELGDQGKKPLNLKKNKRKKTAKGDGYQMPVKRGLVGSRDSVDLRFSFTELGWENLALPR